MSEGDADEQEARDAAISGPQVRDACRFLHVFAIVIASHFLLVGNVFAGCVSFCVGGRRSRGKRGQPMPYRCGQSAMLTVARMCLAT